MIGTCQQLEAAACRIGLLPFFRSPVRGLSVEEMTAPDMLFGENGEDGAWEWKGPVIRERTTAYGKFFVRKAGFVSRELLTDFLSMRRQYRPITPHSVEEELLAMLMASPEGLTSAQMREELFGFRSRRTESDLVDTGIAMDRPRRNILEPALQRLQMGGRIVIADFLYKHSSSGERYGWGEAVYATPENIFDPDIALCSESPIESYRRIAKHVKDAFPQASETQLEKLIR